MCECFKTLDNKLAARGLRVRTGIYFNDKSLEITAILPEIPLVRIDGGRMKKADPQGIIPKFCPWCGKKYRESEPSGTQNDGS